MFRRSLWIALAAVSLGGCASAPAPSPSANHPASPDADEAPLPPASTTLSLSAADPVEPVVAQTPPSADHGGHADHGAPSDSSKTGPAPESHPEGHDHGTMHEPPAPKTQPAAAAVYTCPMHPDVVSDKPGKCPKCGMRLIQKKGSDAEHGGHS
jgi:hypothetical protein